MVEMLENKYEKMMHNEVISRYMYALNEADKATEKWIENLDEYREETEDFIRFSKFILDLYKISMIRNAKYKKFVLCLINELNTEMSLSLAEDEIKRIEEDIEAWKNTFEAETCFENKKHIVRIWICNLCMDKFFEEQVTNSYNELQEYKDYSVYTADSYK